MMCSIRKKKKTIKLRKLQRVCLVTEGKGLLLRLTRIAALADE